MDADHERRRLAFGAEAELYDRVRPPYPVAAVRWLVGEGPLRVLDLGAGTGILSWLLHAEGHEVVAVEPDDAMRALLASRSPGVEAHAGQAEEIPLPDASVDAVLAAQAHWWFDGARAFPEIARVLRDGGVFGALWNGPDGSVSWAAELKQIESGGGGGEVDEPAPGPGFEPLKRARFTHGVPHTADTLVELIRSRAYFIAAAPERQAQLERDVRLLAAGLPERFELPLRHVRLPRVSAPTTLLTRWCAAAATAAHVSRTGRDGYVSRFRRPFMRLRSRRRRRS